MNKTALVQSIQGSEGLSLTPYRCPTGKLTIGYGRNLEEKGISKTEANLMLENDVLDINNVLFDTFDFYQSLNDARQNVLIEMVYNLGFNGFSKFKAFIQALKNNDFETASKEMLDSKWHRDFIAYAPNTNIDELRSSKLSKLIKEGKYV